MLPDWHTHTHAYKHQASVCVCVCVCINSVRAARSEQRFSSFAAFPVEPPLCLLQIPFLFVSPGSWLRSSSSSNMFQNAPKTEPGPGPGCGFSAPADSRLTRGNLRSGTTERKNSAHRVGVGAAGPGTSSLLRGFQKSGEDSGEKAQHLLSAGAAVPARTLSPASLRKLPPPRRLCRFCFLRVLREETLPTLSRDFPLIFAPVDLFTRDGSRFAFEAQTASFHLGFVLRCCQTTSGVSANP